MKEIDKTRPDQKRVDINCTKDCKVYEKYVKKDKCVTVEIYSLTKEQQHPLMDLLPLPPSISRAT